VSLDLIGPCLELYWAWAEAVGRDLGDLKASWEGRIFKVRALSLDPVSGAILVAFKGPIKSEDLVAKSLDLGDRTVTYARLDLDSKGRPVTLEILP